MNGVHEEHFTDVAELIAAGRNAYQGHEYGNARWRGTDTFEQALDLYHAGWMPGSDTLAAMAENVHLPEVTMTRVTFRPDVTGGTAHVGRILAGDPRTCTRVVLSASKPVVTIAVTGCPSAYVDADDILRYGAVVVAVADRFNAAGYGVNVIQVDTNRGGTRAHDRFVMVTNLKRSEEPFDLSAFAFAVAHPAMFRRFLFAACEGRGLGSYGSTSPDDAMGHAWCTEQGVDVDLTGQPPSAAAGIMRRVVDALDAYRDRSAA